MKGKVWKQEKQGQRLLFMVPFMLCRFSGAIKAREGVCQCGVQRCRATGRKSAMPLLHARWHMPRMNAQENSHVVVVMLGFRFSHAAIISPS